MKRFPQPLSRALPVSAGLALSATPPVRPSSIGGAPPLSDNQAVAGEDGGILLLEERSSRDGLGRPARVRALGAVGTWSSVMTCVFTVFMQWKPER